MGSPFLAQPYLISGQNIKTVGGESLLGPGNIDAVSSTDLQAEIDLLLASNNTFTGDNTFEGITYYRGPGTLEIANVQTDEMDFPFRNTVRLVDFGEGQIDHVWEFYYNWQGQSASHPRWKENVENFFVVPGSGIRLFEKNWDYTSIDGTVSYRPFMFNVNIDTHKSDYRFQASTFQVTDEEENFLFRIFEHPTDGKKIFFGYDIELDVNKGLRGPLRLKGANGFLSFPNWSNLAKSWQMYSPQGGFQFNYDNPVYYFGPETTPYLNVGCPGGAQPGSDRKGLMIANAFELYDETGVAKQWQVGFNSGWWIMQAGGTSVTFADGFLYGNQQGDIQLNCRNGRSGTIAHNWTTPRFSWNSTGLSFNGSTPIAKPTVSGSRGGNAALQSLLTALANYGLITDSTS